MPIIQVALSGEGLTEQNLADIGINQLRTPLVTVPGAAMPYPFGGKQRQIQIDLIHRRCRRGACPGRMSQTRSPRKT